MKIHRFHIVCHWGRLPNTLKTNNKNARKFDLQTIQSGFMMVISMVHSIFCKKKKKFNEIFVTFDLRIIIDIGFWLDWL